MAAPHQLAASVPPARPVPTLLFVDSGLVRPPWRSAVDGLIRRIARLDRSGEILADLARIEHHCNGGGGGRGLVPAFRDVGPGFLERAWPVLREAGITPTLFVHTARVGHRPPTRSPGGEPRTLSWSELRQLADAGVPVASAGHIGPDPGSVAGEALFGDLVRSYRELESRMGRPPRAVYLARSRASVPVCDLMRRAGFGLGFHGKAAPPYRSRWGLGARAWSWWGSPSGRPWDRGKPGSSLLEELPGLGP